MVPGDVDEDNYPRGLLPSAVAEFLAHKKASFVADRYPDAVVLGADTVVAFGDQLLGKARDVDDARRILELLSGTTHLVITGVAVVCRETGFDRRTRSMSAVRMRQMSLDAINRYLATGDWIGKAGAYGIQDSDPFVVRLTGSHTNIVGLPMAVTKALLAEAGIAPPHPTTPVSPDIERERSDGP